ncbi:beta-ketoacyl synthase [Robiginitalea sp. SC105]|uniref:beta-ketoacyl-[acyl-carrier-protein] synthase family protein n=1 Tax=Robiginitalea sp. SC105 TaxID=2762332 RepID=UPI00163B4F48|nr:beta-ketoacyl-[acyl-carrier-protein] synthase family protein [Robiginitalea sp. SC105]MBC2840521.1 beta-ketoacyl-[acyl-carrier-protein] synthase family protein [Robiginitalea sp. SC105]
MKQRVVVTGLGICAPNGIGISEFSEAMFRGRSGIRYMETLRQLGFRCPLGAAPEVPQDIMERYFSALERRGLTATGLIYGAMAGQEAWYDAGLDVAPPEEPDWDTGVLFGTGILGVDTFREAVMQVDAGNVRRLGSTTVPQTMGSGVSAWLAGKLGCGNWASANSSACSTGTEAILQASWHIRQGRALRMLVGSCSDSGPYIWGGFDAMRILSSLDPADPAAASRPMSARASGFVPGSGAGALLLESLESARSRGARIYAEILGGAVNNGGQRGGGSMTAANAEGVRRCIRGSLEDAGVDSGAIDLINGHLTATTRDPEEIRNWCQALGRSGRDFPLINSSKDVLGHGLAASGSMESVGTVLQLSQGVIYGNTNASDLHPEISRQIDPACVPVKSRNHQVNIAAKASFGFGDVNSCIIFSRHNT